MAKQLERRDIEAAAELRDGAESGPVVEGYAIVFGKQSGLIGGQFREIVDPNAQIRFDNVYALHNHDPNRVLGSTQSGTLKLERDQTGVRMSVVLPKTTYASDLVESMRRGDVNKQSFAFHIERDAPDKGQRWQNTPEGPIRTITAMRVVDVSIVTNPAYSDTSAALRSAAEILAEDCVPPTPETDWRAELAYWENRAKILSIFARA